MNPYSEAWDEISTPAPTSVAVRGAMVMIGQRVRLAPRENGKWDQVQGQRQSLHAASISAPRSDD